ncbi:hypothetical protein LTR97_001211 [Elasticomyces elasticus]|uniref:BTB domain-containing protein n=1 Tax=Elasticomyces elasticus TaxID=574655 RepID=A0AAN8A5R6_9PEZI|nr:hypothetical protein LTR97_001211 [Elasticomyces elasticus]
MALMEEFARDMHDELVIVRVGQDDNIREFRLPKALLRARIAWFDKALHDGHFQESATGVIMLPEDDPNTFTAVHYYIYHQTLSFPQLPETDEDSARSKQLAECIRIWIMGHKYCITGLQNCAMQRACALLKEGGSLRMDNEVLKICFSSTAPGSPLRSLAMDHIVDQLEVCKQPINVFHTVFACSDGASVEELFDTQAERKRQDENFPRYNSPLRHKHEMYVKDAGNSGQADWNKNILLGTTRGSCEDCGIFDGSPWCGMHLADDCNMGECGCNVSCTLCRAQCW